MVLEQIPIIGRSSKTTAQELNEFEFENPGVIITCDIEAMFPSINLKDVSSISKGNAQVLLRNSGFGLKILKLILLNNYMSFSGGMYRQLRGATIGTCLPPPFANLYFFLKVWRGTATRFYDTSEMVYQ